MKTKITLIFTIALALSGCCTTKFVLKGNGNTTTGTVGGSIEVTACTPMEKETAKQLEKNSDWYKEQLELCKSSDNPIQCRSEATEAYKVQQEALLDLLKELKDTPKENQETLYDNRLSSLQLLHIK